MSSVALGDVVLDSSGAGHVEIVTNVGTTPSLSTIYISSHTNNRYNVPLSQLYSPTQASSYLTFYRVSAYLHPPAN
ncbi:amidase domain-containing protein [Alicyclobacillus sendaiensis]